MIKFIKKLTADNKKLYHVNCPVCTREFSIKFNSDEVRHYNFKYKPNAGIVYSLECDFCDSQSTIVQLRTGEIEAIDNKWGKTNKEFEHDVELKKGEISSIRKELVHDAENSSLISRLHKLETELEQVINDFNETEKRYEDHKIKWFKEWQAFQAEHQEN